MARAARVTVPADLWLSGLIGMEEKVGTAVADGALVELYGVAMEREYGPGVHNAGAAVFSGSVHATAAAGFRQLFRVQQGIRNLTPGGGASASGPPAPASPPADGSGVMLMRSAAEGGGFGKATDLADTRRAAETTGSGADIEAARQFDRGSVLADVTLIARTEDGQSGEVAAALRRLGDTAGWPQANEAASADAGENAASARQAGQSSAPATGNWWDFALDDDGVWMTRLFSGSDPDETAQADETESVEELWARTIFAKEQADDLWQKTSQTKANSTGLHLTAQDILQSAYLETGDLAKDMLRPYVDELDLPPKTGKGGRLMTNTEIVDEMDRESRFRGLQAGKDGMLVRPPLSKMPPFQARDAFIHHMESARAAGDAAKANSMQATLKSVDAQVSEKMREVLEYAKELHKWDGIPLPAHIDPQKLLGNLQAEWTALLNQMPSDPLKSKEQLARMLYYMQAAEAVSGGLDPAPALAEVQSLKNFGDQVKFSILAEVRRAVNQAMDNPRFWNSATVAQPPAGGYLEDLKKMRRMEQDVYRADEIYLPAEGVLTRGQKSATDFANIRLNEVLQAHGLEPEPQALDAVGVRARLYQLRGDYFRAGDVGSAWDVQRAMDTLDLQISYMVDNHMKTAEELAKPPLPLPTHIDAAAARLEELVSGATARASELEFAGNDEGARRERNQASIFQFALDELRNTDNSGNPAPRDPRSLIDYQIESLPKTGAYDARLQAFQNARAEVHKLLDDTRRFDPDAISSIPAQRVADISEFDEAGYAAVGSPEEWGMPPVQEPSPQRRDVPQIDIDLHQLDVEGLNLADNPWGAASPPPPTGAAPSPGFDDGFRYAAIDDSVKAPGWSEPSAGPSKAAPRLGDGAADWVEPHGSSKLLDPGSFEVRVTNAPNSVPSSREAMVSDWAASLGRATPPGLEADFAEMPGDAAAHRIYGVDPDSRTGARLPVPGGANYNARLSSYYGKSAGEVGLNIDPGDISAPTGIGTDGVESPIYATLEPPATPGGSLPEADPDAGMRAIEDIYAISVSYVLREVEPASEPVMVVDDGVGTHIYATVGELGPLVSGRTEGYQYAAPGRSATSVGGGGDVWGASAQRFSGQPGGDGWMFSAIAGNPVQIEWADTAIMNDRLSGMLAQPEPSWLDWFDELLASKLDDVQNEWIDDTLRQAGPEVVEDVRQVVNAPVSGSVS